MRLLNFTLIPMGLIPRSLLRLLPHSREALPLSACGEGTKGRGGFQILRSLLRGSSLSIILFTAYGYSQEPAVDNAAKEGQGYRIERPGTITFTVGVKIKGKVEKPQVMIFLPKEKPVYKEITLTRSFYSDIMEPLPFDPGEK